MNLAALPVESSEDPTSAAASASAATSTAAARSTSKKHRPISYSRYLPISPKSASNLGKINRVENVTKTEINVD